MSDPSCLENTCFLDGASLCVRILFFSLSLGLGLGVWVWRRMKHTPTPLSTEWTPVNPSSSQGEECTGRHSSTQRTHWDPQALAGDWFGRHRRGQCRASAAEPWLGRDSALYNALEFMVFLNRLEFSKYWSLGALTKRTANWNLWKLLGGIGTGCNKPGQLKHGFSCGRKRFSLHGALNIRTQNTMWLAACDVSQVGPRGRRLGHKPFKIQTFEMGVAQTQNAFHMSMRCEFRSLVPVMKSWTW